jgi:hypothetical protein
MRLSVTSIRLRTEKEMPHIVFVFVEFDDTAEFSVLEQALTEHLPDDVAE